MDPGHQAADLLRLDVRLRGVRIGVVADAIFDEGTTRLLGLDVRCGGRTHRFLPLPACELRDGHLVVDSPLVLLEHDVDFYRRRGRALSSLRGLPVARRREELGRLADLRVAADGSIDRIVVRREDGTVAEHDAAGLAVGADRLRPAV